MARLILRLFGPGSLKLDEAVVRPHSVKVLALLAYLALESDRVHARSKLASLLWDDLPDTAARQSLRQAIYSLRTLAGGRLKDCLSTDHERVGFSPNQAIEIDVHQFVACVRSTEVRRWREAAALYGAPLLEDRILEGSEGFNNWLAATRERMHALAVQNLERLVVDRSARSDWDLALHYAERMRDLDPTSEASSRQLLRVHAARKQLQALDAEWARLRASLRSELDVSPSEETSELYATLRSMATAKDTTTGSAHSAMTIPPAPASRASVVGEGSGDGLPHAQSEAELFVRAAQAAERVYGFSQAADLYDRALKVLHRAAPGSRERCCDVLLLREASLARLGRRAEQSAAVDEALAIAVALGDVARLAPVLLRQASAATYLGDHAKAQGAAERARDIYRGLGDQPGEAEALRELGFTHWRAGEYAAALRRSREALDLHRRVGDVAGEASALHNLAEIHRSLGSPRQAIELYEQALGLHWAARNHEGEILTLFGLASALSQADDPRGASAKYDAALKLSEARGERTMQSRALHALAMLHAAQGEGELAFALMRRAIEVDRAIGYAHALGHDLVDLAVLHLQRGERVEARAAIQEALVWFGFGEDREAMESTLALLRNLDAGADVSEGLTALRGGVKSHMTLGEGKVYCEFESPLAGRATG